MTPSDVVQAADITFSCLSDAATTTEMVFGNCGVLTEMTPAKAYVELTTIDDHTSALIADAVAMKGGRYLEAQIQGCKAEADLGTLVIIAAGDKILFNDCQSCFLAMSKNAFYLGEIGNATKMNGVLQMIRGIILAGVAESCALADRLGLQHKDILEILQLTSIACPAIMDNIQSIVKGTYRPNMALQHLHKDMKLALRLGNLTEFPLPITATANEVYKDARRLGYGLQDVSSLYLRARF